MHRGKIVCITVAVMLAAVTHAGAATAQTSFQRITGEGSSWSANAVDSLRINLRTLGLTVDYNPSGSSAGRKNFLNGTVDFAVSDVPFQFSPEDGSAPENPAAGSYAYIPATAGGTAFMYNLTIDRQPVTNLRLSSENVAKIFTGSITNWNHPAIAADNPGLRLPDLLIVPVVRSDGAGSTAQFTRWMLSEHTDIWNGYCQRSGRAPACGSTSFYPTVQGMIAQSGDIGVAGYVSQGFAEGSIGYVNYSYATNVKFPAAKVLNKAGFYTEPTPSNVAVSLSSVPINTDPSDPATYLTPQLDAVYDGVDPRNYELSSYSYFIVPTAVSGQVTEAKGTTLAVMMQSSLCDAQQQAAALGYAPLPISLVQAGFDQIGRIPGAAAANLNLNLASCANPTIAADGSSRLAELAPMPAPCDAFGVLQCSTGTGGARDIPTAVAAPPTTAPSTTSPAAATPPAINPVAATPPAITPSTSPTTPAVVGAASSSASSSRGSLPATGGSSTSALIIGALLVVFGRAVVLVVRRPRTLERSTSAGVAGTHPAG
jgi:phosphate transport system substrate-binding protein